MFLLAEQAVRLVESMCARLQVRRVSLSPEGDAV